MKGINVIFWDFDGVLMNSNQVRDIGFERVLSGFPENEVKELMTFHQANGGLSRYVKFRYFFEDIRKESISEEALLDWASKFSAIMKELLVDSSLLIQQCLNYVKQNQGKYKMHITSGSDQEELRYLCKTLQIDHYFSSIHGSPKPKSQWVKELIEQNGYNQSECVLIGDSINDWEAATKNEILFMAYNNERLNPLSDVILF